jgi:DNA-binding response OmpR family regulator
MDRVLVVEDSKPLQKALQRLFETDSLDVAVAPDGVAGLAAFQEKHPSAVVLDLKLPGRSGKELCRDFKASAPEVPIIVLSANSEIEDKVLLLELGADDYVTKPFSPKELLARVRRAMRRSEEKRASSASKQVEAYPQEMLEFGQVQVNFTTMQVLRRGENVALTAQEFKVLRFLSKTPGRVVSREELLNEVWGYNNYPTTRTVDNHILRLRQKLEADATNPEYFLTVHGVGYKFVSEPGLLRSTR